MFLQLVIKIEDFTKLTYNYYMSYEVTATRRRPQHFDDLIGQEFVAETLKNSIKSGKIAHAYLLSGPRGCGKTSTARILAKALNCKNGPTDNPCGECSNCKEITKGTSLDVIEIDGASNTSVENIRQIKDEVLFPPNSCRYKIYIIDEVHMLSTSAFNALLKTIEEPPPYVIFIFATTELQKVPATIKSRCQQFNFRLVPIEKVKECLKDAANELNIQAEDEALFWIARESTGSMRDAYTLFDQIVSFSGSSITYEKIKNKLGLVGIDQLNTLFELCVSKKTDEVLLSINETLQNGISIEQFISNCTSYIRSLLFIKCGIEKESLLGNKKDNYSSLIINEWNSIQLERALSIFLQLYRDIRYSISPKFELELAFSRLCWLSDYVSNVEVKKAIDAAQNLLLNHSDAKATNQIQEVSHQEMRQETIDSRESTEQTEQSTETVRKTHTEINHVPQGLPTFEILSQQKETPTPFLDGGALPPDNSVQNIDNHSAEAIKQTFSNDDWSNTETPPDDVYYNKDDEDSSDYDQNSDISDNFQNLADSYESKIQQQPTILDEKVIIDDGREISVQQLKGNIYATLAIIDGFTVTALEKTENWKVNSNSLEATIKNAYDFAVLEKKKNTIQEVISKIFGKNMNFIINLKDNTNEKLDKIIEIPKQVAIICDLFKGTIL